MTTRTFRISAIAASLAAAGGAARRSPSRPSFVRDVRPEQGRDDHRRRQAVRAAGQPRRDSTSCVAADRKGLEKGKDGKTSSGGSRWPGPLSSSGRASPPTTFPRRHGDQLQGQPASRRRELRRTRRRPRQVPGGSGNEEAEAARGRQALRFGCGPHAERRHHFLSERSGAELTVRTVASVSSVSSTRQSSQSNFFTPQSAVTPLLPVRGRLPDRYIGRLR